MSARTRTLIFWAVLIALAVLLFAAVRTGANRTQ
jgi:hypothetical protein